MEYGPALEDAKVAQAWLEKHNRHFGLFVNNEWVTPSAGHETYTSCNPATGDALAEVDMAQPADIDMAVAAAQKAQESWGKTKPHARARILYSIARHLQKHARLLAVLETLDNGKVRGGGDGTRRGETAEEVETKEDVETETA